MKSLLLIFIGGITLLWNSQSIAQLATCGAEVPFFQVDLTGQPDGIWESPSHIRKGNCCGTSSPDRCTSFEVILDAGAAMINLEIVSGAVPEGALFYQIDCGPTIPVGEPICISGVGPHNITFCKPGNNQNIYRISSIAQPLFPDDIFTRIGCTAPFNIYGLEGITINSINASNGNTTLGAYNSLLDCIDCPNPTFSPGISTPDWIDYEICGGPLASICGYIPVCDTVRIYTLDELNVGVSPDPAFFCASGTGVVLNASPTGGDGAYNYSWTDGSGTVVSSTANYNATTEETFTIEVSDGLNSPTCPSSYFSIPVTVGQPPVVNAGADIIACAENPTVFLAGSVDNATGGQWSGGSGTFNPDANTLLTAYTPSAAELTAGSATLTLTSTGAGGGCTDDSDNIIINFIDTVKVNPTFSPIVCSGGSTTINANATGGSGTYTYIWSNGATTPSINVTAGTYSVMVQDDEGCGKGATVTVNDPAPIVLQTSSNPTSDNDPLVCDGDATVVISGGVAPYTIEWDGNPALNTSTVGGLCYGVHNVSVTDANGCTVATSVVVNNPLCSSFDASIVDKGDVSCYGDTDGFAEAQVTGGTAPYNYSWNSAPVQTTALANNLGAGTYDVTVTDDNGCQVIETVTITQPQIITNTIISSDATSIGGSDGSATANPQGGTAPYNYSWVPGAQTTQTAINLSEGTYYLTIVDDKGCIKQDSVLINQPPCNDFTLAVDVDDVNCNGDDDGSASVLIAHGTPPYTVDWIDGGGTIFASGTTSVSGLAPDSYTVQVEDQSNCLTFTTFDITEPDALSIGLDATNVSCNGSGDGTIDLTVSGGTYPYSYQWYLGTKPISTTQDIVNLIPGTYSVTITDANGCSITESIGITQPAPLKLVVDVTDISCAGADDGSLEATASGGTLPYGYFWSGPGGFVATTQNISGLTDGLYEVQVVDGNGCSLSVLEQAYVNEPDTVSIDSVSIDCPTPGASVTIVDVVTVTGGDFGSYSISFDNGSTFQTAGDYSASLTIGSSYTLIAEDGSGCQSPIPFVLNVNPSVVIDSVVFNPCIPAGATTIPVTVYPNGGENTDYSVSLDGGSTFQTAGTYLFNLNVGQDYDIVVKDENDCASLPNSITIPNELLATATLTNQVSCIGESDGAINLNVTGGTTAYSYNWSGPSGLTATTQNISGLIEGTYDIDVTDQNGCVVSESIAVTTLPDVTNPVVSCPTNISVSNDPGDCGALVNYTVPVGTDDCPGATTTLTNGLSSGVQFPIGITTVEYTVTDLAGNSATCSFDVEVIDNELPTITCPADVNETADLGLCEADAAGVTLGTPTTNDNCGVATVSNNAPLNFPVGNTVVTWTVTDVNGNVATCAQNVTIADVEAPIISDCGVTGSQTVSTDLGTCTYSNTGTGWDVTATDNCTTITVEYTLTGATTGTGTTLDGVTFNNGTTTVTWTVSDTAGNASTCTYDIVVEDNELPIISDCGVTGSQTVSTDLGTCTYTNTGTGWDVTATDNCTTTSVGYALTGATIGSGTTLDGVTFNNGTTTVVWTVTDAAGNASTCTYDIVVEDNELPIISDCGVTGAQTVLVDPGVCSYTNTGTGWDVVATDNCTTITIGYTLTGATTGIGTTLDGVTFNNGTTTVEWTVTDAAGNASTCTYDIEVVDDQLPSIAGCPSDINATNDSGICGAVITWIAPTADDNCGVASFTSTHNSGDVFPVGTTTVTYTATDAAGNVTICSFDITILDSENPVINGCPSDITVSNDAGTCGAVVTWALPTASDNCGVDSFTSTHNSGDVFNVGTTTVTYTAVDAAGNSITCSFDVIVEDDENPTILCQPDLSVDADPGVCEADASGVNLGTPVTGDNCGVATITNDAPASYPVGTTVVTWTVTDVHGNTATCTQNVDVEDTQAPIISDCGVSGSQTVIADAGACTFTNTGTGWDVVATDNCTTITIEYELTGATTGTGSTLDGVAFNNGTTTVTWTVTDDAGNTSVCSYEIIVNDEEAPVVVDCPTPITVGTDVNECGALVTWTPPTFTDNCTTVNVVSTHNPGDYFAVGTTTVTYTGTDAAGNQTQCAFDVIVNDTELPTIACQADIETCDSIVTYAAPTTDDNCGVANVTMIAGLPSGSDFPVGTTTVTYEVEDIHGNTAQCSFDVTVFPLPEADIIATDVSCNGLGDGALDLTVTNGTAPYSFAWSNGSTDEDLTGIVPGTYDVVITDDNGCTTVDTVSIAEPALLEVSYSVQDVLCNGGNDGSIDLTVTGGVAPYSYSWNNGSTDEDLTGLTVGTYDVTVTDDNGCTVQSSIDVTEPDTIQVTYTSTPATCEAPNGTITIDVVGGTAPFTYNWSNGETTADLNSAVAGSYELTLTDDNGCTFVLQAEVESESNLNAEVTSSNLLCNGDSNGSAVVTVITGNSPFTYEWSHGPTTATVNGLSAGQYSVMVTDAYGCTSNLDVEIEEPEPLEIVLNSPDLGNGFNVTPYGNDNGSILSETFGGTPPYSYDWTDGSTFENISNLEAGSYSVTVTDSNGCSVRGSITLNQPMVLEMPSGFSPNDDGRNDYFVVRGIEAYPKNEIKVFNRWGNMVYQKNNYANEWEGTNIQGEPLPDGTYFVLFNAFSTDGTITLKGYVDLRRSK